MKLRYILVVSFLAALAYILFKNEAPTPTQTKATPSQSIRKPTAENLVADERIKAAEEKKLPQSILNKVPLQAPKELSERWSHQSNFEDADYMDTQLHLDGRPIDGYYFKWAKRDGAEEPELIAGSLPRIEKVNGAFPLPQEVQQIVNSAIGSDTEVLSTQEVWNLNSNRVLTPQAKVEVTTKSRSQRSSGHEYWFISLNTGKVVKRVEADRN